MKNEKYKIEIGSPPTGSLPTGEGGGRGRGAVALLLSIPLFLLLNLAVGSVAIPFDAVFSILMGGDCDNEVWTNIVLHTRLPQALTAIAWSAMSAWLFSVSSPFGVGKRSIWLGLGAGLTVFVCVFPFIYASQRSLLTMSMIIPVIFIVFFVLAGYWLSTIFSTSAAYKYTPVFGKQFRGRKGGKN